jgi:hypothetical protein
MGTKRHSGWRMEKAPKKPIREKKLPKTIPIIFIHYYFLIYRKKNDTYR